MPGFLSVGAPALLCFPTLYMSPGLAESFLNLSSLLTLLGLGCAQALTHTGQSQTSGTAGGRERQSAS